MVPFLYTTHLQRIYGAETAARTAPRLQNLIERRRGSIQQPSFTALTEKDALLITYGDQVQQPGTPHLQTLAGFCETRLKGLISGLHILPFFPWSSDDGFSVMDYRAVDPALGTWPDVERLGRSFRLMFDGVINHASVQGNWFQAFLRDEAPYRDYFITIQGSPDLSTVVRPRTLPLLTAFSTTAGERQVWTTFSADQADLEYHNPDVLLEMVDILLMYASRGAQFIRLDAIAYLWKEIGTTCIHLPQTHAIVQLIRAVLDEAAPHVRLITETNVPHAENISYFGNGSNEAQLVYNFALPPLVMHTLRTGDAAALSAWADELKPPSTETAFFNFLASHDGIGLNPARGILRAAEMDALAEQTLAHGGLLSYKQNPDGTQTPYEMNINWFDALSDPQSDEAIGLQTARFMAAQAIMMALQGVPGIYFHSLFGSRGWPEGVQQTGSRRAINRQKLLRAALEADLTEPSSLRSRVFGEFTALMRRRAGSPAFHPQGAQKVMDAGGGVFALQRTSPDGKQAVLCLHNVTARPQSAMGYELHPYQVRWLER